MTRSLFYQLLGVLLAGLITISCSGSSPESAVVIPTILPAQESAGLLPPVTAADPYIDCMNNALNNGIKAEEAHIQCDPLKTAPATETAPAQCQPGSAQEMDLSQIPAQENGDKDMGQMIIATSLISVTWSSGLTDNVIVESGNTVWIKNPTTVTMTEFDCDSASAEAYATSAGIQLTPIEELDEETFMVVPNVIIPIPLDQSSG